MNNELPIQLYKANAELQLQITRLLQESGHRWLEAMQQLSAGSVEETTARIQSLQQAADWQTLATLPSEVFRRLYQGRVGDAQALAETAAKSQSAFVDGLRQALTIWQASVSETVGASGDAASFAHLFQPWTQPWSALVATPQSKAEK